jgi:hypothetical protein
MFDVICETGGERYMCMRAEAAASSCVRFPGAAGVGMGSIGCGVALHPMGLDWIEASWLGALTIWLVRWPLCTTQDGNAGALHTTSSHVSHHAD